MKPEKGLQNKMEDKEWDPRELFITIGMLIVEARLPEISAKGRIEGPHCPQYPNEDTHVCSYEETRCCEAQKQKTYMETLVKNRIPMCIELLLFPKCQHSEHHSEVTFLDSNAECTGEELLLERWDIHMFPKRWAEKSEDFVTGRFLLQAMRSYLFFSQLSSWLNSTGGVLPLKIAYRLYAPGESPSHMFQGQSHVHHFPAADLPHSTVKVCVSALQRLQAIPILLCQKSKDLLVHRKPVKRTDQTSKGKPSKGHYVKDPSKGHYVKDPSKGHYGKDKKTATICDKVSKSDTPDSVQGITATEKVSARSKLKGGTVRAKDQLPKFQPFCDVQAQGFSRGKTSPLLPTPSLPTPSSTSVHRVLDDDDDYSESLASKFAKLDVKSNPLNPYPPNPYQLNPYSTASREVFSEQPLVFHVRADSSRAYNNHKIENRVKMLHSPKVLLTNCNPDTQEYYSKRHASDENQTREDSDWYAALLGQPSLHDLSKPLTSDQIEAYLASLPAWGNTLPKVKRTCLENIPVTKCKFQIGDETEKSEETDDDEPVTTAIETISSLPTPNFQSPFPTDPNFRILTPKVQAKDGVDHTRVSQEKDSPRIRILSPNLTDPNFRILSPKVQAKDGCDHRRVSQEKDSPRVRILSPNRQVKDGCDHRRVSQEKDSPPTKRSAAVRLDFYSEDPVPHPANTQESSTDQLVSNANFTDNGFRDTDSPDHKNRNLAPSICVESGYEQSPLSFPEERNSPDEHSPPQIKDGDSFYSNGAEVNGNAPEREGGEEEGEGEEGEEVDNKLSLKESPQTTPPVQIKRSLYASVLRKDFAQAVNEKKCSKRDVPSMEDITNFHKNLNKSTSMLFNASTGLPTQSSPAPVKKKSGRFDYDSSLTSTKAIKNALSCSKLVTKTSSCDDIDNKENSEKTFSTSAPASTNCLLGNFEESILNGRIEPSGVVEGFLAEIGASGTFCPKHISLPVTSYFFSLSDDNAPSPYLGHINLETYSKKGYHIPKVGTVQVTLFNPNKTVVKMFVVMYDLQDMPSNAQTFMRQRTMYMPADVDSHEPSYLRYLIHLRISSSRSGKLYLHTDIRLIFARDKFEYDARVANYELRSFTEGPKNPKFSPKR